MSSHESTREKGPGRVERIATGYQFSGPKKRPSAPVDADRIERVFEAVLNATDGSGWIGSHRLDIDGLCNSEIGAALFELADDEDCPIDLECWSGDGTTPKQWRVTPEVDR